MVKKEKNWFNYIVFDTVKTYVGSTVDIDRRIRQHNKEIKGGAKYTAGGTWEYYCVIYNLYGHKNKCLSEEWQIKHATSKVKGAHSTKERRQIAVEQYIPKDPYEYKYVFFVARKFLHLMPKFNSSVFVFVIDIFTGENIKRHVNMFNKFIWSKDYEDQRDDRMLDIMHRRSRFLKSQGQHKPPCH
jgi:predicted GIY-YIG superfamily endonuclease